MLVTTPPAAGRFQLALSTSGDDRQFEHVAVDWWDQPARLWRPSVIVRTVRSYTYRRMAAVILAPAGVAGPSWAITFTPRRVRIGDLRLSRCINEGVSRFFLIRYRLELLDSLLVSRLEALPAQDQSAVGRLLMDTVRAYGEAYSTWSDAYRAGLSEADTTPRVDEAPSATAAPAALATVGQSVREMAGGIPGTAWDNAAVRWRPCLMLGGIEDPPLDDRAVRILVPDDPAEERRAGWCLRRLEPSVFDLALFALPVLARDLSRLGAALTAAGCNSAALAAHPLIHSLTELLGEGLHDWRNRYHEGTAGPRPERATVPLEPSLWGFTSW